MIITLSCPVCDEPIEVDVDINEQSDWSHEDCTRPWTDDETTAFYTASQVAAVEKASDAMDD